MTVRHEEMINAGISLEGERVKNWGDGCVRYRFVLRTTPQPCLEAPSHTIESRRSTDGNHGSRMEGAKGEARFDELRAVDRLLSLRIAKGVQ